MNKQDKLKLFLNEDRNNINEDRNNKLSVCSILININ